MADISHLEPLLRRLLAQTHEISIILLDHDGLVIGWSGAAQISFGYAAEEVLGKWFGLLFTKADSEQHIPEHELSVAASGTSAEDDRWLVRKDGGRIWVTGITTALRSEPGELLGFAKVVRDRTDLKTQMDHNTHKIVALDKDNQRLANLLHQLGTQLRQPLTLLLSSLDAMEAFGSKDLETPLTTARRCVIDLHQLVDESMGSLLPSAQNWEMAFFPVELGALLKDFANGLKEPFALRGIVIRVVVPKAIIIHHVNPAKMNRLLEKLSANALRHMPHGGTIWLTLTIESNGVAIRLKDTGEGIAPQVLSKIFDLFSKGPTRAAIHGEGGLWVVKRIADEHGGSIEVRSAGFGHGSEFTLRLPR